MFFGHVSCIDRGGVAKQTKSTALPAAPVAGGGFSFCHPEARKKCLTSQGRFGASVHIRWDVSSSTPTSSHRWLEVSCGLTESKVLNHPVPTYKQDQPGGESQLIRKAKLGRRMGKMVTL